jgi:hypothetical protein
MCGRAIYKLTWEEIVALYRLTLGTASHNFQRTGRQTDLGADALGPRIVNGRTWKPTSRAMIITEPIKFIAEVHDRMTVLLAEKG